MFVLPFSQVYVDKGVSLAYGGALGEKGRIHFTSDLGANFLQPHPYIISLKIHFSPHHWICITSYPLVALRSRYAQIFCLESTSELKPDCGIIVSDANLSWLLSLRFNEETDSPPGS